jgi:hypothetical protein
LRFACSLAAEGRYTHLACEPGEYDGHPPVPFLKIANRIRFLNADRLAVASALLFSKYISGSFATEKAIGPATVAALRRFLEPGKPLFEDVSLVPAAIPVGDRDAVLLVEPEDREPEGCVAVKVGFADDQAFSSYLTPKEIRFATNARLFAQAGHERTSALMALTALFAEDFSIRRILSLRTRHLDQQQIDRQRQLLASVNIALEMIDDGGFTK